MKSHLCNALLMLLLLGAACPSFAQVETPEVKRIKLADLQLSVGALPIRQQAHSLEEFQALFPESKLINTDFSGYFGSSSSEFYLNVEPQYTLLLGFDMNPKEGKKSHKQFRLGISYREHTYTGRAYSRNSSHTIDTLASISGPDYITVDSLHNEYFSMSYGADQLQLDASLIFRTDPTTRFSLYAGVGLSGGVSVSSTAFVSHNVSNELRYNHSNGEQLWPWSYNSESSYVQEHSREKMELSWAATVPLGVDFRLSKKAALLNRMHLFAELRPGIRSSMTVFGNDTQAGLATALGLRVAVH